jgi:hypothetical protein
MSDLQMKPLLSALVCLLSTGVVQNISIMAAESPKDVPPCAFDIIEVQRRYSYFAEFAIVVTNKSEKQVLLRHFDGPPFEITFVHARKSYLLRHKADWYATEHGASRPPVETAVGVHATVSFAVDLKGDYVVVSGGRAILFREFGANKEGIIKVRPIDAAVIAADVGYRSIEWDGRASKVK